MTEDKSKWRITNNFMMIIGKYYESNKDSDNSDEINKLKESIERREKLLSNENYVNKAPKNIVDLDKQKLEEEKKKLEELMK